MELSVANVSGAAAFANKLFLTPQDADKLGSPKYVLLPKFKQIWPISTESKVLTVGQIGLPQTQALVLSLSSGASLRVQATEEKDERPALSLLRLTVSVRASLKSFSATSLEAAARSGLADQIFSVGQRFILRIKDEIFKLTVDDCEPPLGVLTPASLLRFDAESSDFALNDNMHSKQTKIFPSDFDFEKIGVGGLGNEFEVIFRRAFASRLFNPAQARARGIKHVGGMILYGPPGTGKTLIATKLAELLQGNPILKSAPELLNQFVGKLEQAIRELFAPAAQDQQKYGDDSPLHVIILDEIDAVFRQRGASNHSHTDGGVNQLLAMMDGPTKLNNVLVIGMTNRLSLLDTALLRPGRFEIQLEIGLPDEAGRLQILKIHTADLTKLNNLDPVVKLEQLVARTKNFTGADIMGLVKSATSFAMSELVNPQQLSDKPLDLDKMLVTPLHFQNALNEIKPAFGSDNAISKTPFVVPYGQAWNQAVEDGKLYIEQVRTTLPFLTVLVEGERGTGKTTLIRHLAKASGYTFVKEISPSFLNNRSDYEKASEITRVFDDALRVSQSIILLEDLEALINYTSVGPVFSNVVLQTLHVLLNRPPENGKTHLLVLATTSKPKVAHQFGLREAFNALISLSPLNLEESSTFLSAAFDPPSPQAQQLVKDVRDRSALPSQIPVKTLNSVVSAVKANPNFDDFQKMLTKLHRPMK